MSSADEIEEDILEEIAGQGSEPSDVGREPEVGGDRTQDVLNHGANAGGDKFADNACNNADTQDNSNMEQRASRGQDVGKVKLDYDIDKDAFIAIEGFSSKLAGDIVQEAMLINDIYMRDRMNALAEGDTESDQGLLPASLDVRSPGYDQYIIEKFLQSSADPMETMEDSGFQDDEQNFREHRDAEDELGDFADDDDLQMNAAVNCYSKYMKLVS